jgi:iodotyrosine deiodinase
MPETVPLNFQQYPIDEMRRRAEAFFDEIRRRRTVREFSDRPVPFDIIDRDVVADGHSERVSARLTALGVA